jgi:hypothetical protein
MKPASVAFIGQRGVPATIGGIEHHVEEIPTAPTKHLEALVHSGLSTGVAMLPGKDRADILHYHAIGPSVFTPLPRALTRRGVVLTIHGLDY